MPITWLASTDTFRASLRVEDHVNQEGFNRILRAVLTVMAVFFVYRALRAGG